MPQAIMIQNDFDIPVGSRHIGTAQGYLFMLGGFDNLNKKFLNDAYYLDEYRSMFRPIHSMFYPRAEHVVHKFKDNLYVFGGMAYRDDQHGGKPFVQSLNTCEYFNIVAKKWFMLPSFEKARQCFSVCQFNDRYIFIIGGKCLKPEARVGDKYSFNFVDQVEAFDIDRNTWKTINYIQDSSKLRVVHAGAIQVNSKSIMIFGGMVDPEEGNNESENMADNGQDVQLTNQSYFLDVTVGTIKRGPELNDSCYFINNVGSLISMHNKLYAQGFRINHEFIKPAAVNSLAAAAPETTEVPANLKNASNTSRHKKVLHCYNLLEEEFSEIHEGIFASNIRKQSVDLDD